MMKILIIDDEKRIRDLYQRLLEDEGYEVLLAKNAVEGTRQIVTQNGIDLILLDINMPEVDGAYMKEIIDEYDPSFKIIVSSVRMLDEQKELIPQATDYFDKSSGTEILTEKINKALQNV
jgi:CheY-like chemotaxis protein